MNNIWIIVKKELKRVFSDRRLVFTTFLLPALSIAMMYSLMGSMLGNMLSDVEENVPSIVLINTPESFESFAKNYEEDFDLYYDRKETTEELKGMVKSGRVDLLVVFEGNFETLILDYQSVNKVPFVHTYYTSGEDYSDEARYDFEHKVLVDYRQFVLGQRLGNEDYTEVYILNENIESDLVDEGIAVGKGLSMLIPTLISIFLFAGAMSVGMDSIAGEKERGTMATLLVTPVKRGDIAVGKILALGIVALLSAASSFLGVMASMPFAGALFANGGEDSVALGALGFSWVQYLQLAAIMVTLVGIYVGLISTISIIAKNVKEAGTYVSPVYIVVMMAGFMNMFTTGDVSLVAFGIPVYGSVLAIKNIFTFELTFIQFIVTVTVSLVTTGILVFIIKTLFEKEEVMFNN